MKFWSWGSKQFSRTCWVPNCFLQNSLHPTELYSIQYGKALGGGGGGLGSFSRENNCQMGLAALKVFFIKTPSQSLYSALTVHKIIWFLHKKNRHMLLHLHARQLRQARNVRVLWVKLQYSTVRACGKWNEYICISKKSFPAFSYKTDFPNLYRTDDEQSYYVYTFLGDFSP